MRDKSLIDKFRKVLKDEAPDGQKKEQIVQDFMENNPEIIPTPNRLNHHLHLKAIISKFRLGEDLITDYIYITKSSDVWRITLVELEVPEKKVFKKHSNQVNTTALFNDALNQVRSWKNYIDDNKSEVIKKLWPLITPPNMRRNPIEFRYELIIGRSDEKNTEARNKHLRSLIDDSDINILSYDSVINYYENDLVFSKDIMKYKGGCFNYKYLNTKPEHVFSYIGPGDLKLTKEQKAMLINEGYEIDKWEQGEYLTHNTKYTKSTMERVSFNEPFNS